MFAPFAGFAAMPSYPEYSADFFDGEHFVMKGASTATARELLRPSFRNWFRPRYPYVYAAFRCVRPRERRRRHSAPSRKRSPPRSREDVRFGLTQIHGSCRRVFSTMRSDRRCSTRSAACRGIRSPPANCVC